MEVVVVVNTVGPALTASWALGELLSRCEAYVAIFGAIAPLYTPIAIRVIAVLGRAVRYLPPYLLQQVLHEFFGSSYTWYYRNLGILQALWRYILLPLEHNYSLERLSLSVFEWTL
jgi:hypothetical protein